MASRQVFGEEIGEGKSRSKITDLGIIVKSWERWWWCLPGLWTRIVTIDIEKNGMI